jgi:hypothetical protein
LLTVIVDLSWAILSHAAAVFDAGTGSTKLAQPVGGDLTVATLRYVPGCADAEIATMAVLRALMGTLMVTDRVFESYLTSGHGPGAEDSERWQVTDDIVKPAGRVSLSFTT